MEYEMTAATTICGALRPKGSTSFNDPRNRHFTEEEATYKELAEKQGVLPEEFKKIVDEHFFEIL